MGMRANSRRRRVATAGLISFFLWLALSYLGAAPSAVAQVQSMAGSGGSGAMRPWVEFRKQLEDAEQIAGIGEGFAGERVSIYDGATSFSVTDILVPGNFDLPVQLVRSLAITLQVQGLNAYDTTLRGAGNWDVDVPYLTATYPVASNYPGGAGWPAQRCSNPGLSVPAPEVGQWGAFWGSEVWSGISIHIPGGDDSRVLALNGSIPVPTSGGPYRLTSTTRSAFDCIPMKSGVAGEGFRLTTTSGVRYYFDVGLVRDASELEKWSSKVERQAYVMRWQYYMLASKIEDRFGNTVLITYNADGHPTRIWSSDGREIVLAYSNNRLTSATSHGRTWTYQYDGAGNLTKVVLPDASNWRYAYSGTLKPPMPPPGAESFLSAYCDSPPAIVADVYTLATTGPSGASANFRFENLRHYRSGVAVNECVNIGEPLSPVWSLHTGYFFDVMSLTHKTVSGPGLSTATWAYSYERQPTSLWGRPDRYNPYPCTTCALYKTNTVMEPDGTQRRYRFGMEYALNDGRQLQVEAVAKGGSVVRTQADTYMSDSSAAGQLFYSQYGDLLGGVGDPGTVAIRPIVQSTISQDGATFTTARNAFDRFARSVTQTESNSLGYSRVNETTYHDNTGLWVLGQPAVTKVNGITTSTITYSANAQPLETSEFGKRTATNAWNLDGTLSSVSDGNGRATNLSGWKRGLPQTVAFADGSSRSAAVNDSGWITSLTDETGFATSYGYDAMGRLASITYPAGDDVAWNQKLLSFAPVGSSEYGIPAGHWKHTIRTGNGYTVTYFDALWRPMVTEKYDSANKAATLSQTVRRYDTMGRTIFTSYPTNGATSYTQSLPGTSSTYDGLNRLTQAVQSSELGGLPTTTQYLAGFQTRVTDPRGYATTTSFQAFGEPDTSRPASITMPEGVSTTIARDVFGKPLSVTRSGRYEGSPLSLTRSFVYDANQLLCKRIEPETSATLFAYDGANNLAWSAPGTALTAKTCDRGSVSSGQMITRGYDARDRLISIAYPDGVSNTQYIYAADGAMVSTSNSNGGNAVKTQYAYDKRRLLTAEALTVQGGSPFMVGYAYDANGNLGSLSYPDRRSIAFSPNAIGQPTQAGSYATDVRYYPNGAIKQFNQGDGSQHLMTQNLRGLPERSRDSSGPTVVLDNTTNYDASGNVAAITDGLPSHDGLPDNAGNIDMSYDGLNRLTKAISPMFAGTQHQATFTLDPLDNLRSVGVGDGNQYAYAYDAANRLASMTGSRSFNFAYDARGNQIANNAQAYTFDMADRLRSANGLESYLYDAGGRRARKVSAFDGAATYYVYDRAGSLLFETYSAGTMSSDYVYLAGSLVAKITKGDPPPPPPPSAPAWINVPGSSTDGNVTVSWAAVTGVASYVQQQQFNGGAWTQVYSGGATSKAINGLANGSYVYRAQACNSGGCGAFATSSTLTVNVPQPPPVPGSISVPASSSTGNVSISWSPSSGATSYVLQQQFNDGGWTKAYSGPATSANPTGLASGAYVYRVEACNVVGCSGWRVSGTLTVALIPAPPAAINVPSSSYSPAIPVSWSASTNATNYVLQESVNGGGWGVAWSGNATSTTVTVPDSGTYRFQVAACAAGGCSGFTLSGNVAVTLVPSSAPNLTAPSSSTTGTFTLTWTPVAGATRYQLNQNVGGVLTVPFNANGTSWTSSGLSAGTYYYQVFACNAAGCGPGSNIPSVTVSPVPAAPAPVTAPSSAWINEPFTVTWTAASGTTRYELQQTNLGYGWVTTAYSGPNTSTVLSLSGPADTMFQYAARACNSAGCSPWADAAEQTYLNDKFNPKAVPASGRGKP